MAIEPGSFAAGITMLILFGTGLIAAILVKISRRRQERQEVEAEEGHATTKSSRISTKPPQLPTFSTRSSLSMSPESSSPRTPTPGIRFTITTPSHRSRKSGSIDSLPSMETVLEKCEQEAEAADERVRDGEQDKMLSDSDLGEPGPSIPSGTI